MELRFDAATIVCGLDMQLPADIAGRFWSHVEKTANCWLWTGGKQGRGYGQACIDHDRLIGAHRLSWLLHFGDIPDGMLVLHRCDMPACVRPEHLFLGTYADNANDAVAKGRWRPGRTDQRGARNHNAKLSDDDVRAIRTRHARGETQAALAKEFGVTRGNVWSIVKGRSRGTTV